MVKCKNKRNSFILLESILAIGIIGLTSALTVKTPSSCYKKALNELISIELSRLSFSHQKEIEDQLKINHCWDSISEHKSRHFFKKITIDFDGSLKKEYDLFYYIQLSQEKEGENQTQFKLIDLTLVYENGYDKKNDRFDFKLLLSKAPSYKSI